MFFFLLFFAINFVNAAHLRVSFMLSLDWFYCWFLIGFLSLCVQIVAQFFSFMHVQNKLIHSSLNTRRTFRRTKVLRGWRCGSHPVFLLEQHQRSSSPCRPIKPRGSSPLGLRQEGKLSWKSRFSLQQPKTRIAPDFLPRSSSQSWAGYSGTDPIGILIWPN